jgi:hypothetical protein
MNLQLYKEKFPLDSRNMASDVGRYIVNLLEKLESKFKVTITQTCNFHGTTQNQCTIISLDVYEKGNFYHFTNLRKPFKVIKNDNFTEFLEIFLSNFVYLDKLYNLSCSNGFIKYELKDIDYKKMSKEITRYSKIASMVQRI